MTVLTASVNTTRVGEGGVRWKVNYFTYLLDCPVIFYLFKNILFIL